MDSSKLLTKYGKKLYDKIFLFYRRCRWHRWLIREYLREFSKIGIVQQIGGGGGGDICRLSLVISAIYVVDIGT